VLVLGGGGILGEAWMSALLAGLEEGGSFDARGCALYLGTSAGSIVATSLVAGIAPDARLGDGLRSAAASAFEQDATSAPSVRGLGAALGLGSAAAAPLASLLLSSTSAGGALLRRAALRGVPRGRRSLGHLGRMVEASGVDWDGRLRVAAVELESGRRVMFDAPGAPPLSVAAAVRASCAIPGVFAPVRAGGRSYVDGGAWSPTNMDAAEVSDGDRVLCLNPTGSLRRSMGVLAAALGPVSRGVVAGEALALRHRGATVTTVNPDARSAELMGANLMDPAPRSEVIAAGFAQGRRLLAPSVRRAA
jgi:NTE family protein